MSACLAATTWFYNVAFFVQVLLNTVVVIHLYWTSLRACEAVIKIQPERAKTAFRNLCLAFHHLKSSLHYLAMLFLRKSLKLVPSGTKDQILRLKCTKFYFGWGSATDPARWAYRASQTHRGGHKERRNVEFTAYFWIIISLLLRAVQWWSAEWCFYYMFHNNSLQKQPSGS